MATARRRRQAPPTTPTRIFSKKPFSFDETLYQLWQRGLRFEDKRAAETALKAIGYFRLSIYMRCLQDQSRNFIPGTKFSHIVELYEFDRNLRSLTMDATERLEVGLRASLSNDIAVKYGAHWHLDQSHFEDLVKHHGVMSKVIQATDNKKSLALKHYHESYCEPRLPPVWLTCEKLSFGALSWMFSDLKIDRRKLVASTWGYQEFLLVSWFRSLTDLRNECAHHGRLWQSNMLSNQPMAHTAYPQDFRSPRSFYARAAVIALLLDSIGRKSWWKSALVSLFAQHSSVSPSRDLGFPYNWENRSLWS